MTREEFNSWLKRNNLSLTALAKKMGMHRRTVQRWSKRPIIRPSIVLMLEALEARLREETADK